MKYKKCDWIDLDTNEISYGIQVYHNEKWHYACDNKIPLFYCNETDRDEKLKEINKG